MIEFELVKITGRRMANPRNERIEQVRRVFGDHLTPNELAFLTWVQQHFKAVLDKQEPFKTAVDSVAEKFRSILKQTPPSSLRLSFDAQSFRDTIPTNVEGHAEVMEPLTERESELSNDVIDAIEFVVCNGIGFGLIAGALCHDLNEIIQAGGLDKAIFNPKVSGWAEYQRVQIGVEQDEDQ